MYLSFPKNKIFIALDETNPFSVKQALENYGYSFSPCFEEKSLLNEFSLLRRKIIANPAFNNEIIAAVILPYEGIQEIIDGEKIGDYLLEKRIPSFLRIDDGVAPLENGARVFLPSSDSLNLRLSVAKLAHYVGIKTKSLIYSSDNKGIKRAVNEEFKIAKAALKNGLIPIIEIEIDIRIADREKAEKILLEEILKKTLSLPSEAEVIYRLSFPEIPNYFAPLLNKKSTVALLASTSGYTKEQTMQKLKENPSLTPAFSRAILANLKAKMDDGEFSLALKKAMEEIRRKECQK